MAAGSLATASAHIARPSPKSWTIFNRSAW